MSENVKQESAKLRRKAIEIGGIIHDIVEDRLMTDYKELPALSTKLIEAIEEYNSHKQANNL